MPEGSKGLAITIAAIAMAAGVYVWLLERPVPVAAAESRPPAADPLKGLALAFAIGIVVSFVVVFLTSVLTRARSWRAEVALAFSGLYLAASLPALGGVALVLAPVAVLVGLGLLVLTRAQARSDGLLLAFHAGSFWTALCFFHQWPRYQSGWAPFVRNFKALIHLWF